MMFEHAENEPILVLNDEQCWKLLEHTKHGRLVLTAAGEADIFPINYKASEGAIYFRSGAGTKVAELTVNDQVLFETDGILSDQAWSVIVRGTAEVLETASDIEHARKLGISPWVPTVKDFYVKITPTSVSGRHFQFGQHPEAEI
ncbi:pyridoxamine 5'-phosphate oxidase family protein [Micrococcoides hystricis]|uniref:Pyridoxamine 5'-phosphate oxidase family protein n=1 Tax=Micrococcoides hystricis TaxID=1572761 RepID=A0ABV6P9R7_9MICC